VLDKKQEPSCLCQIPIISVRSSDLLGKRGLGMVWLGISGPTFAIDSYVFYMHSVFIVLLDSFCLVDSPFLVSHGMPTQI